MIQIKSAFEASFAKLLASLRAGLDARAARITASLKATLDANSTRLLNDIKAKLAALEASNSALLDKIKSTLNGPVTQDHPAGDAASSSDQANEHKTPSIRRRIRSFFSYIHRVLITGRLRPPVVGHREHAGADAA